MPRANSVAVIQFYFARAGVPQLVARARTTVSTAVGQRSAPHKTMGVYSKYRRTAPTMANINLELRVTDDILRYASATKVPRSTQLPRGISLVS